MAGRDPRSMVAELAAAKDVSLTALSTLLRRNAAYVQQYVTRGKPRVLAERDRRLLADFFGVGEEVLGGPPPPPVALRLPRLDIAASAGPGALVDGEVATGADMIDPALARRLGLSDGQGAIIRVRGDSMEPGLVDGDLIVVDRGDRRPGRRPAIYVIRIDDLVMVKRVAATARGLVATSDNSAAAPVPAGPIAVIGRVVWQMRVPR